MIGQACALEAPEAVQVGLIAAGELWTMEAIPIGYSLELPGVYESSRLMELSTDQLVGNPPPIETPVMTRE